MKNFIFAILVAIVTAGCRESVNHRKQISLNGEWEITKTSSFENMPTSFESKIPVPGLVDLAKPALDVNRNYDSGVYWHRTSFTIDEEYPELVKLYVGKAKYRAKVYLNDQYIGEQLYAFTSATFDVRDYLKPTGEENELLIGIGVQKDMPDSVIWGRDPEKLTFIPGIYDDVKLILSGAPYIRNVQIAPLIDEGKVRIVADIDNGKGGGNADLTYAIRELKSGKVVAKGKTPETDFTVGMPGFQLWSPESPFLYVLDLSTGSDNLSTRFGMRSFSFDKKSGRAILNGKTYFMRGTNVTLLRFFEDPERESLPWNEDWTIRLHQKFKEMNWNSIRYCIGLPPERWYEIADSLGFLIQNEYPIWTGFKVFNDIYPGVTPERLANEYRAWLPEHWNHPSVVIWDAQNESITDITGQAINMVRDIDLSNRPWDNGWSAPAGENDPIETHPYLFIRYRRPGVEPSDRGALADLLSEVQIPGNGPNERDRAEGQEPYGNPILINEYAWLWLNRDGSTTTLTDRVYDVVFGKDLTTEQRFNLYAKNLGILTEYWRAHRLCAGVLHFCGLGYSRPEEPRGQTSDHFIDIKNLEYEPNFVKYVKPSFAPVGLMINFWEKSVPGGINTDLKVYVINDLESAWSGPLKLTIRKDNNVISELSNEINIPGFERTIQSFPVEMPLEEGAYELIAEIEYNGEPVRSIRDFEVR